MAVTTPHVRAVRSAGPRAARRLRESLAEVGRSWRIILQATVAATAAYAAALAIGHQQPFFAPIAALATVAISLAHRLRRATELLLGNAVGIFFADLLIAKIGTGPWQLGLVVAIALVGVGVTAILGVVAQTRRTERQTARWAEEETRAAELLMDHLHRWELFRSDQARRANLVVQGEDAVLGAWSWSLNLERASEGRPVGLFRVQLEWKDAQGTREVSTHAALRIPQA